MAPKKRETHFDGIRPVTKKVLKREDVDAEFKVNPNAIDNEVLVSFANSPHGGWVIGGVDDKGAIVGCKCGDQEMKAVQSRATDCKPSIAITITVENLKDKPILVVHVPPSPHRPHCTGGGKYVTRVQNRMQAIDPTQMLGMFLERESAQFVERFREASTQLSKQQAEVTELVDDLPRVVDDLLEKASNQITQDIGDKTDELQSLVSDLETNVAEVGAQVDSVERNLPTEELHRIEAMLRLIAGRMGMDVATELSMALLRRQLSVALALGVNIPPDVISAWREQHSGLSDERFQATFEEERARAAVERERRRQEQQKKTPPAKVT